MCPALAGGVTQSRRKLPGNGWDEFPLMSAGAIREKISPCGSDVTGAYNYSLVFRKGVVRPCRPLRSKGIFAALRFWLGRIISVGIISVNTKNAVR